MPGFAVPSGSSRPPAARSLFVTQKQVRDTHTSMAQPCTCELPASALCIMHHPAVPLTDGWKFLT